MNIQIVFKICLLIIVVFVVALFIQGSINLKRIKRWRKRKDRIEVRCDLQPFHCSICRDETEEPLFLGVCPNCHRHLADSYAREKRIQRVKAEKTEIRERGK